MKINVLDDVKTLNERSLNLFNKDEQLEVANLQEQVKNYLEKNSNNIVISQNTKKEKVEENKNPVSTVIEIRQEKSKPKEEKSNIGKTIFKIATNIAKEFIISKAAGKFAKVVTPIVKASKEKVGKITKSIIEGAKDKFFNAKEK